MCGDACVCGDVWFGGDVTCDVSCDVKCVEINLYFNFNVMDDLKFGFF